MRCFLAPIVGAILLTSPALAQPLTTAFTYQGALTSAGAPANGTYDLRFRLYDALISGTQQGPTLCSDNVSIASGTFSVLLDFGAQYAGQRRWLEVDVRQDAGLNCTNSAGFTTLGPRQEITATPSATFASSASTATNATTATTATTATNASNLNNQPPSFYTNAANLTAGTIPSARVSGSYTNALTLSNASNSFTGSFSGSGANLTGVPFASLTGVPATVSLQGTSPGTAQTGNLNLSGRGLFSRVGIGTSAPESELHVFSGSAGTISPYPDSPLVLENNASCYINLLAPDANETGLLFGRPGLANIAGSILYNSPGHPDALIFRTANLSRVAIDSTGNLGIGTISPTAKLHVVGSSTDVILPAGSINAAEVADEPGVACHIPFPSGAWNDASAGGDVAVRTIACPAAGYVLATGSLTLYNPDPLSDASVSVGVSDVNGALLTSNDYFDTVLGNKYRTVTVHGLFSVSAGNKTIHFVVHVDNQHAMNYREAHLTLLFIPTAYGTANTDQ